MKITSALLTSVFAVTLVVSAHAASGKVEAVNNEGRQIVVGGQEYAISNSRTKVTIKGKEAKRDQIKAGMTCDVQGEGGQASAVSCK